MSESGQLQAVPTLATSSDESGRALVIAETLVDGSAFSSGFGDVRIAVPAELEAVLVEDPGFAAVLVSGSTVRAGQLADVLARIIRLAPADTAILIDVSDEPTWQELCLGASPFAGLQPVGARLVAGRVCVAFTRATDGSAPPLDGLSDAVAALRAGTVPDQAAPATEPARVDPDVVIRDLRLQLDEVTRDLAVAHTALATSQAKSVPQGSRLIRFVARGRTAVRARGLIPLLRSKTVRRLLLPAMAAFVGLVVLAGISIAVAALTDSGVKGGFEVAGLLFLTAAVLYLLRGMRRIGRNSAAAHRLIQRVAATQQTQQREMQRLLGGVERKVVAVSATAKQDLTRGLDALSKQAARRHNQAQAVENLFGMFPVNGAVPLMGGWTASPDVVLLLVDELIKRRPRMVVECGSGVSTLWLALTVQKFGLDTRIVALEHDPHYAVLSRETLARHGVADVAEVRDAPLTNVPIAGHETVWYSLDALDGLEQIGLVFVDGPPEATGPRVRYPAVPMLRGGFADAVTIVLDDFVRESEQEISTAWEAELPDFTVARLALDKGAVVFRRG